MMQCKLAIDPTAGCESERPCFRRLTIPPEITWTLAQPARVNHNRRETEPVLACSGPDSDSVIGFGSRSRTAGRHPRVRVYGEPRLPALRLCSRCGQGFQPKCSCHVRFRNPVPAPVMYKYFHQGAAFAPRQLFILHPSSQHERLLSTAVRRARMDILGRIARAISDALRDP